MFLVGKKAPILQLRHGKWFECTVADLVYPAFLFLAGVSMAISTERARERGVGLPTLFMKLLRRVGAIFILGLLLSFISARAFRVTTGTLQSIAVAIGTSLPVLLVPRRFRLVYFLFFLAVSYFVFYVLQLSTPDEALLWNEGRNVAEKIDLAIFGKFHGVEGVVGSVWSASFVILGVVAGGLFEKSRGKFLTGSALLALGCLVGASFLIAPSPMPGESPWVVPVVTRLISPSFVLFAGAIFFAVFALVGFFEERIRNARWFAPIVHVGENPLLLFTAAKLFQEFVLRYSIGEPPTQISDLVRGGVSTIVGPEWAYLSSPLLKLALIYGLAAVLARRGIRFRF